MNLHVRRLCRAGTAALCASLLFGGSAHATTFTLNSASGADYDSVGDGWFFTTPPNQPPDGVGDSGNQTLAVGKINGTLELRAMAEFSLASLTGLSAADIQTATLHFRVDDIIGTFGPGATFDGTASDPIAVYGYPADGTVNVSDFNPAGLTPQGVVSIGVITDASLLISGPVDFTVDVTQLLKDRLTAADVAVGILFGTNDSPTATSLDDQSPGVGGLLPYLTVETVPTDPPVFSKDEVKCQAALAKQGLGYVKKVQGELSKCLNTVLGAVSKGDAPSTVASKCTKGLDEGDPKSVIAKAHAAAATSIGKSCGSLLPANINSPCDAGATTIAATTTCVLDDHRRRAEQLIAAEYSDACTILRSVSLETAFPDVCAP
jgi:hypothetical protein